MAYKIAVASSDGLQIDETFGSTKSFIIYEVEDGKYSRLEERTFHLEAAEENAASLAEGCNLPGEDSLSESCHKQDCSVEYAQGAKDGCGSGAGNGCGNGSGCGSGCGGGEVSAKVELISDCRCIVCKKIGFHIQKQLERKAISAFDVSCSVEEALSKISYYFNRMDNHESLRVQK